jgi:hypothetical protein
VQDNQLMPLRRRWCWRKHCRSLGRAFQVGLVSPELRPWGWQAEHQPSTLEQTVPCDYVGLLVAPAVFMSNVPPTAHNRMTETHQSTSAFMDCQRLRTLAASCVSRCSVPVFSHPVQLPGVTWLGKDSEGRVTHAHRHRGQNTKH